MKDKELTPNKKTKKHKAPSHEKKKKISFFYKISFFITLFISLILLYFIILVAAEPKSFPYITKKIENYLQENFGRDASMESSYISFTPYGSFKISINNLKISKLNEENKKNEFIAPLIEGEFPLYNVLLLRFTPKKVRVIDPIIIYHISLEQISNENNPQSPLVYSAPFIGFLAAVKHNNLHIKNFYMENVKFSLKKEGKADTEILIKKSQIKVESKNRNSDEALQISSVNIVKFNNSPDINLNANCKFSSKSSTICNLGLLNLATSSLADLNPSLTILDQIKTQINATAVLTIENQQIQSLTFKAEAKNGYFDLPKFFSKKINFSNLSLQGDYNNQIDALNLSLIEADLNHKEVDNLNEKHLSMSLFITNLQNLQNKKLSFFIKLKNIPTLDIEGFWPISIPGQDIRKWVIEHIDSGRVENAFARFSLTTTDGETDLDSIDSQMTFTDLNLDYDDYFPKITSLKGVAGFSKDKMRIEVSSANVLNSQVSDALITIDDFQAPTTILNIAGNINGNAADGLRHANYKSSFATDIEKYFNGNASGNFDIKIPLKEDLLLKDLYISVNERIQNFSNSYLKGDIFVKTLKDFNKDNFDVDVDLTSAAVISEVFDIEKKSNDKGSLSFSLAVNTDDINIKNINLEKEEEVIVRKKPKIIKSKISANIILGTSPLELKYLKLQNRNFGNNNYSITYQDYKKTNLQKISIRGKLLNLESLLKNKLPFKPSSDGPQKLSIEASLNKILLTNNKSIKNFSTSIYLSDGIFYKATTTANYSDKQSINFGAIHKANDDFSTITGNITDAGYLAEGLGVSDKITGGNAEVKITNKADKNMPVFIGEIKINSDITFYENNTTKRLAKNSLFSAVKDTIFSNNKTTFSSVKLEFTLDKKNLQIDSMIANNYKIGITAKGFINLEKGIYDIKGMIIPGFVVNNLFGIGKIPLIGGVISGVLTGGEGGGLFGIKYEYKKLANQKEATFETNKVSAFVPVSIRSLFE